MAEEHLSNLLAWLFDPVAAHGFASRVLELFLECCGFDMPSAEPTEILLETEFPGKNMKRRADILVRFGDTSPVLAVEVKIDRTYEDSDQLRDYRAWNEVGETGFLVLLCPRGEKLLGEETLSVLKHARSAHLTWNRFLAFPGMAELVHQGTEVGRVALNGMKQYFDWLQEEDFKWMAESILEETGWREFYPDDFKDKFMRRFARVYERWAKQYGERGNGGAHQRLTAWLVAQSNPRSKNRLLDRLSDQGRPPKHEDWGYPVIYKYRVRRAR